MTTLSKCKTIVLTAVCTIVLALFHGCVERKEFITVKQDGSVALRVTASGDHAAPL